MTHPEKWTFDWFYSRLKPHKGDVYRPGQALPEPGYETATGRRLYTVQQIRAAYAQGAKDSRSLLTRCRNMLSHPAHWGADDDVMKARHALYTEVLEHLNGLAAGIAQERNRCRYPQCVENEDERCPRWLTGECGGPNPKIGG
jgi:hypothetical protein